MNTNKPNDDAPLKALLRAWNVKSSLPPRFTEQVWRRIEHTETSSEPAQSLVAVLTNWIANRLPRPALATAYVTVLLAIGSGMGWSQAKHETMQITSSLSTRYVQAVDPYQATP